MSVSYYLFSKASKEYISLGSRGRRSDYEYEGPVIWMGPLRSRLPRHLLQTLIDRFREAHGTDDVVVCSSEELFDSTDYLTEDEMGIEVGGERDGDLPLTKYLPELDDPGVREEIRSRAVGDGIGEEVMVQGLQRTDLDVSLEQANEPPDGHSGNPPVRSAQDELVIEAPVAVAVSLEALLQLKGRKTHALSSREVAEAWLVFYTMHVRPADGRLERKPHGPASIAFEVEFDDSIGAKVLEVFPRTEHAEVANGKISFSARLNAGGGVAPPVGPSAEAQAVKGAGVELRLPLLTPKVISVGTLTGGSSWYLYRREQPLFGNHVLAHTVLVPRGTRELSYEYRVRVASMRFFNPTPFVLEWRRAACELDAEKSLAIIEFLRSGGVVVEAIAA
jgi:hypothetical protein